MPLRDQRSMALGPLIAGLLLLWPAFGCGAGGRVLTPEEAAAPAPEAPRGPDAFDDFPGDQVDPGKPFAISIVGAAVREVRVVVSLEKVTTSSWQDAGGNEVVEATAALIVERGTDTRRVRVKQGQSSELFGARIKVVEAKVDYDERRFKWVSMATLVVEALPAP